MFKREDSLSETAIKIVVAITSFLYFTSQLSQALLIGSNWVRWYLSDIGFPFAAAVFLGQFLKVRLLYGILIGGLGGIGHEIYQFFQCKGDPLDVVYIILSTCVGVALTHHLS